VFSSPVRDGRSGIRSGKETRRRTKAPGQSNGLEAGQRPLPEYALRDGKGMEIPANKNEIMKGGGDEGLPQPEG